MHASFFVGELHVELFIQRGKHPNSGSQFTYSLLKGQNLNRSSFLSQRLIPPS